MFGTWLFMSILIISLSNGSDSYFWDATYNSCNIILEEEILQFQDLLGCRYLFKVCSDEDSCFWSLGSSNYFTVKSSTRHLASSSHIDNEVYRTLCKFESPKKTNILLWIMVYGSLNSAEVLQRKLSSHCFMLSI